MSETPEFESVEDLTISPDLEAGEQSPTSPAEGPSTQSVSGALGMREVAPPPALTLREPPMQGPQDDCSGPRSPELSRNDPARTRIQPSGNTSAGGQLADQRITEQQVIQLQTQFTESIKVAMAEAVGIAMEKAMANSL